jgi:hypothetical protein
MLLGYVFVFCEFTKAMRATILGYSDLIAKAFILAISIIITRIETY